MHCKMQIIRSMKQSRFVTFLVLVVALIGIVVFINDFYRFTQQPLALPEDGVMFVLHPGTSVIGLADELTKAGYLQRPNYFRFLAKYYGVTRSLKAGEYKIPRGTTPAALLTLFVEGRVVEQTFTLIEGWTIYDVLDAIHAHEGLVHTLKGITPSNIMSRLGYPNQYPEGLFYPDTYHFPRGTTDVAFLKRAYQRLQRVLLDQWATRARGLPLDSPYEALILASIVEKEAARVDERPLIAGVFIRRLIQGMKLQTDPTVIYGMGNTFKGNISRSDLIKDTPYNTYVHAGLPPTPICMPSEGSINAALHPFKGKALYFVSKGDGSHYFSATLGEHNIAVRRFIKKNR